MAQAAVGLIGLAVMGRNLALNIQQHGFPVAVYNRTAAKTEAFLQGPAAGTGIIACHSPEALVAALRPPRIILLMVRAGPAVDQTLAQLMPLLEPGDMLIDGGNSRYTDTERRAAVLARRGLQYVGCGISGGEEGARHGASLMPGGDKAAWPLIRPILEAVAARADGEPCCRWIGPGGSGHFVKMVHNGIEYGDMQLIGEAYHLLHSLAGLDAEELAEVFARWNEGPLNSYLIEITRDIFRVPDKDGQPLVDRILDVAGQKGTGLWTGINALELGVPLSTIAEAVFARALSVRRDERLQAAATLGPAPAPDGENKEAIIAAVHDALYAAKIVSYAQGFMLLQEAARAYDWSLDLRDIALIWRGGCIIRSVFLNDIAAAYQSGPSLASLLLTPFFAEQLRRAEPGWRKAVTLGLGRGVPLPAMAAALTFFDGYRCARLPANLLQAQRDFFGAHTYERTDRPRGEFFHTDWSQPAPGGKGPHNDA